MKSRNIIPEIIKAYEYDNIGKTEEAKGLCLEILKEDPKNFDINKLLGNIEAKNKKYDKALELFHIALTRRANDAYLLNNIGNVYQEIDQPSVSVNYYENAIKIKKDFYQAYINKGKALKKILKINEALESFNMAISIQPNDIEAYISRGNLYFDKQHLNEAIQDYAEVLKLNSNYVPAYFNSAIALRALRKTKEAINYFDKAIDINSDYAEAYYEKSLTLLLDGQLESGFKLYEWRRITKNISIQAGIRNFTQPLWLGNESIKNKTILLYAEQGLGDAIQFSRYCKLVNDHGGIVILEVPKSLIKLFEGLAGVKQLVEKENPKPHFDYQAPLMSLPFSFKTKIETIPNQIPYLKSKKEVCDQWAKYIGDEGFKVAIAWQGSTKGNVDIGRSFPVSLFEGIAKIEGIRLISLQKNEGIEQLKYLPEGMKIEILPESFDSGDDAFLDSAAIMKCVDLVITSDTALTHLAGALGIKTWMPLKYVPDWRWMLHRNDSPWYPNHRFFRQEIRDDWLGVFAKMEDELKTLNSVNKIK